MRAFALPDIRLVGPLLVANACSVAPAERSYREAFVYHAKVTDADSGSLAGTFCGVSEYGTDSVDRVTRYADVIHVASSAGARLVDEVRWEHRVVFLDGFNQPQPDAAFWCSGGGTAARAVEAWACRMTGAASAGLIASVQPVGTPLSNRPGDADGYTLTVDVASAGIVWSAFDQTCEQGPYGNEPPTWTTAEMTIDGP